MVYVNSDLLIRLPYRLIKLVDGPIVLETEVYKFKETHYHDIKIDDNVVLWIDKLVVDTNYYKLVGEPKHISELDIWGNNAFCVKAVKDSFSNFAYIWEWTDELKKIAMGNSYNFINSVDLSEIPEDLLELLVVRHPMIIKDLDNPSTKLRSLALLENPKCMKHLKDLTADEIHSVVSKDPFAIQYVPKPTVDQQLLVVGKLAHTLEYIKSPCVEAIRLALTVEGKYIKLLKDPTEEDKLTATKSGGFKYINEPTYEMQMIAVKLDKTNIRYISEPSIELQKLAVPFLNHMDNPSESIVIECVVEDPNQIQYVDNPSESLQMIAVNKDPFTVRHINDPVETVQVAAVEGNPDTIAFIRNPCDQACLIAIDNSPRLFSRLKNPSMVVTKAALRKDGTLIQHCSEITEELFSVAVNQTWETVKYVHTDRGMFMLALEKTDSLAIFDYVEYAG